MMDVKRWTTGLSCAALLLCWGATAFAQTDDCGSVDWSKERPSEGAEPEEWAEWFEAELERPDRIVGSAAARDPVAPEESFWLVAVTCGGAESLWGVDVGDTMEVRFRERVHVRDCCSESGVKPGKIERVDLDGDGRAEFRVTANWSSGSGVDYQATGDAELLVFPERRVEVEWVGDAPKLTRRMERDGEPRVLTFDGPARGFARYNAGFQGSRHVLPLTTNGSYNNAIHEYALVDGERANSLTYHFCRAIELTWERDEGPNGSGRMTGFRQQIYAPAGKIACGEVLFAGKDEADLWSQREVVGTIDATWSMYDDVVRVTIRETGKGPLD